MHPRMKRAQIEGEKGAKPPLLHTQAVPQRVFCVCTVRVCVHARVFVCIWVLVLYKVGTGLQKDADSVRFLNQIKKKKQLKKTISHVRSGFKTTSKIYIITLTSEKELFISLTL